MNRIKKLYLWAEKIWFSFDQKIRFVLVGGFNTVFAYGVAYCLNVLLTHFNLPFSKITIANVALFIQYSITINVSFWTMRYYVFESHGVWQKEFLKALSVYILTYCINAPIVSAFMKFLEWPFEVAYAVYLVFEAIFVFVLHKYYSFRK